MYLTVTIESKETTGHIINDMLFCILRTVSSHDLENFNSCWTAVKTKRTVRHDLKMANK